MNGLKRAVAAALATMMTLQPVLGQETYFYRYTKGISPSSPTGPTGPGTGGNTDASVAVPNITTRVGQLTQVFAQASGLTQPIAWRLSGSLPNSLQFNSADGSIGGIAYVPGVFTGLSVTATGADGTQSASPEFSVTVRPALTVLDSGAVPARVGVALNKTFEVSGGSGSTGISITASVPGLSASGGTLSGYPSVAGSYPVTVTATDPSAGTATLNTYVEVSQPVVTAPTSFVAQRGVPVSITATATGLIGTPTWSLTNAPSGMTVNGGTVSWTPMDAGVFTGIEVVVTDADGSSGRSLPISVQVQDGDLPLTFPGYATTYYGVINTPLPVPAPTIMGGQPPYSFAITLGGLPGGMTFDSTTGALSGSPTAAGNTSLRVEATDAAGTKLTSGIFNLSVNPALSLSYSSPASVTISDQVATLSPVSSGGRGAISYRLSSGSLPDGMSLAPKSGVISGIPSAPGSSSFTVEATDANASKATADVELTVYAPVGISGLSPSYTLPAGTPASLGATATGGKAPYTFTVATGSLPTGLSLSPSTGAISGTPSVAGAFSFALQVQDSNGGKATSSSVAVAVTGSLSAPYDSRYVFSQGVATSVPAPVTGAKGAASFQIASGSLPSGMALSPTTGAIYGTPTVPGTKTAVIKVTDSTGSAISGSITFDVLAPLTTGQYSLAVYALTRDLGVNIGAPTVSGASGAVTFSVSSGSLPSGLTLATNGSITGTPSANGYFSAFVQARDTLGRTSQPIAVSFDVRDPVTISGYASSYTFTQGAPAAILAPTVSGGDGTYTFELSGGSLFGMSLAARTGAISGPASLSGSMTASIRVVDSKGRSASSSFTLEVQPSLAVSAISDKALTVGRPAGLTASAVGGVAPYSFSVVGGQIPAGLTLLPSGAFSGSPSESGSFPGIVVRVTDATGSHADGQPFSLSVAPAVTWAGAFNLHYAVALNVSSTIVRPAVSGGVAPLSFSWASGTAPEGLSLDQATGALSWSPTAIASASGLSVMVTDANGATAVSNTFSIESASLPVIGSYPATDIEMMGAVNIATPTKTGGSNPFNYEIVSGNLPAGVTLGSDGRITGTATELGQFSAVVHATDAAGQVSNETTVNLGVYMRPVVTVDPLPPTFSAVGVSIGSTVATSTGGKAPVTLSIVGTAPSGLTFDAATGTLSGAPDSSAVGKSYTFQVAATDSSSPALVGTSSPITITVASAQSFSGRQGLAFSAAPSATTGVASWTVAPGSSLPPGLSLSGGTIVGTPTASGSFSTLLVGSNASGTQVALTSVSFTIGAKPTVANVPSKTVIAGANFSITPTASNTVGTVNWSVSPAVAAGLTFDSATGVISGSLSPAGTAVAYTLTATDDDGLSGVSNQFVIAAADATIALTSIPSVYIATGTPYARFYSAAGLTGTPTWELDSGTLPAGLELDPSGWILGVPSSQGVSTNLRLRVTDSGSGSIQYSNVFSITVQDPPTVAVTAPATRTGKNFSVTPTVSPSRTYSYLLQGNLPSGVTYSTATGVISGKPTVSGTFGPFVLTATANGISGSSQPFNIVVDQGVSLSYPVIAWRQTVPISSTPSVSGQIGSVSFASSGVPAGMTVDSTTGLLSGTPVNGSRSIFTVTASDSDGSSSSYTYDVTPIPLQTVAYTANLSTAPNTTITAMMPTVSGNRGALSYAFGTGTPPAGLTVDPVTGAISGMTGAATGTYYFTVKSTDTDLAVAYSNQIRVAVTNAPDVYVASVPSARVGRAFTLTPTVSNGQGTITWGYSGTLPAGLSLNTSTGVLSGRPTTAGTYSNIQITARDNRAITASSDPFTITVDPGLNVSASAASGWRQGLASTSVYSATNNVGSVSWAIATGSLPAGVALSTSGVLSGTPSVSGSFSATVRATDSDGTQSDTALALSVAVGPTITYGGNKVFGLNSQVSYAPTVGNLLGTPRYDLIGSVALPPGISVDRNTGVISGSAAGSATSSGVTIQVTDSDGAKGITTPFTVAATNGDFVIDVAVAPTATQYQSFSLTPTALVRNVAVQQYVSWYMTDRLPTGLSFNAYTGAVSGTPTEAGTFTLRFYATYGSYSTVSSNVTLTVAPRASLAIVLPSPSVSFDRNVSASFTPSVSGSYGEVAWSIKSGALPTGMTQDQITGVISGSPTVNGTYVVTLGATDLNQTTTSDPVTFTVQDGLVVSINTQSSGAARVGKAFSQTTSVTGGTGNLRFKVAAGVLPPGVVLNTTTGALSGTPTTSGTYVYTIRASDLVSNAVADGATATTVSPAMAMDPISNVTAAAGQAFSLSPVLSNSVGSVTWSYSGTLPTGLTQSASGALTGNPTTAGTWGGIKLTALDSEGVTVSSNLFSITIASSTALTVTLPNTITLVKGTSANIIPTVSGGTGGTITWTMERPNSGSWQAFTTSNGITQNASTGAFVGTSTAQSGSDMWRVKAVQGGTTVYSNAMNVFYTDWSYPSASVVNNPFLTQGETVSLPTSVSGTTGTVTFGLEKPVNLGTCCTWSTASNSDLPVGLTFDTNTGTISGVPTGTTASGLMFRVKVSDVRPAGTVVGYSNTMNLYVTAWTQPSISVDNQVIFSQGSAQTITPSVSGVRGTVVFGLEKQVNTGTCCGWGTATNSDLPAGLSFDTTTGVISGTPTAITGTYGNTYRIKMVETRNGVAITVASNSLVIIVNTATLGALTVDSNPTGVRGQFFSLTPTTTGMTGTKTYAFQQQVNSGTCCSWSSTTNYPAGLSFDTATGILSGTPTAAVSNQAYRITATEVRGGLTLQAVASNTFILNISDWAVPTASISNPSPRGVVGQALTITPTYGNIQGTPSFALETFGATWGAATNMGGLTINPTTGVISGTISSALTGATNFHVKVTDTRNGVAVSGYSQAISPVFTASAPAATLSYGGWVSGTINNTLSVSSPVLTGATLTGSYTLTFRQFGNSNSALTGETYPTSFPYIGIGFDTTTGKFTGVPSTATKVRGLKVCAATNVGSVCTDEVVLDISDRAITFDPPLYVTGKVGQALTTSAPTVSGVLGTASYSVNYRAVGMWQNPSTGELYASSSPFFGITFNSSTGTFSGNPTQSGRIRGMTMTVTDSVGSKSATSREIVFDIAPRDTLSISLPSQIDGKVGQTLPTVNPTVTNAAGPLTYSINYRMYGVWQNPATGEYYPGTSPYLGLTFSGATGTWSGTPTTAGLMRGMQVCVSDTVSSACTSELTINIAPRDSLSLTMPGVIEGKVGQALTSQTPVVTNAVGAVTYTLQFRQYGNYAVPSTGELYYGSAPFAGLNMSGTTGVFSGTPTASGVYRGLRVCAADTITSVCSDEVVFKIAPRDALSISLPAQIDGKVGTALTPVLPIVQNSVGTVTYAITYRYYGSYLYPSTGELYPSTNPTSGILFNTSNATFTGTPTASGKYRGMRICATDSITSACADEVVINVLP